MNHINSIDELTALAEEGVELFGNPEEMQAKLEEEERRSIFDIPVKQHTVRNYAKDRTLAGKKRRKAKR